MRSRQTTESPVTINLSEEIKNLSTKKEMDMSQMAPTDIEQAIDIIEEGDIIGFEDEEEEIITDDDILSIMEDDIIPNIESTISLGDKNKVDELDLLDQQIASLGIELEEDNEEEPQTPQAPHNPIKKRNTLMENAIQMAESKVTAIPKIELVNTINKLDLESLLLELLETGANITAKQVADELKSETGQAVIENDNGASTIVTEESIEDILGGLDFNLDFDDEEGEVTEVVAQEVIMNPEDFTIEVEEQPEDPFQMGDFEIEVGIDDIPINLEDDEEDPNLFMYADEFEDEGI